MKRQRWNAELRVQSGRVVLDLPAEVVAALGWRPGSTITLVIDDGRLVAQAPARLVHGGRGAQDKEWLDTRPLGDDA